VAPGESGFITAMLPLNNSILIFKNDGTWRFSYPGSPSKGQQDKISGYIGAANQLCVVDFENYVYVYSQGRLYELINNIYNQINRTVRFSLDGKGVDGNANDVSLSVVTRRLVFRYYNSLYVYFIDTKTWSQWRSYAGTPGRFYQLPADNSSANQSIYVAASQGNAQAPKADYYKDPTFSLPATQSFISGNAGSGFPCSFSNGTVTITRTGTSSTLYVSFPGTGDNRLTNGTTNGAFDDIIGYPGQKFKYTYDYTKTGTVAGNLAVVWLLKDGTTNYSLLALTAGTGQTLSIVAPDKAIKGRLYIRCTNFTLTDTITLANLKFERTADTSPFTLITVSDIYKASANTIEYMECLVRTKSFDYQAPSAYKRMFWWGLDVKTVRTITTRAIPVAKQLPITWGQLSSYTHDQLSAGTWGNPLSYLNTSITVIDSADVSNSLTENGRLFVKILKALRFRQMSFEVSMTTLGNADTGPCKVFSITSYVLPKESAVAKVN
jgi:hypothetical protein